MLGEIRRLKQPVRDRILPAACAAVLLGLLQLPYPVHATTLKGNVTDDEAMTRLSRPVNAMQGGVNQNAPMVAPDFRERRGVVDTTAFNNPLKGKAQNDNVDLGLIKPSDFTNSKFDLGADRGSRELMVAWEAWHHQLSQAIYSRWSDVASLPGHALMRVTVTRDRVIMPQIIRSSGNPEFDDGLIRAIMSLNRNPGLTFPTKSERDQVSFEADYVAATDIKPGFSWVKNDYEKVRQDY